MKPRFKLKTLIVGTTLAAVGIAWWIASTPRQGWTTVCSYGSPADNPGYMTLVREYRSWLQANGFTISETPDYWAEPEQANEIWYRSMQHPEIYVVTSAGLKHARADVVCYFRDRMATYEGTKNELRDYGDGIHAKLCTLFTPERHLAFK